MDATLIASKVVADWSKEFPSARLLPSAVTGELTRRVATAIMETVAAENKTWDRSMGILDKTEIEQAKQVYRGKPKEDGDLFGGSTSYLQRKMQWGYNHAAAVVEALVDEGWLSDCDTRGRRKILGT